MNDEIPEITIIMTEGSCARLTLTPTATRLKVNNEILNDENFHKLFQNAVEAHTLYHEKGGNKTVRGKVGHCNSTTREVYVRKFVVRDPYLTYWKQLKGEANDDSN